MFFRIGEKPESPLWQKNRLPWPLINSNPIEKQPNGWIPVHTLSLWTSLSTSPALRGRKGFARPGMTSFVWLEKLSTIPIGESIMKKLALIFTAAALPKKKRRTSRSRGFSPEDVCKSLSSSFHRASWKKKRAPSKPRVTYHVSWFRTFMRFLKWRGTLTLPFSSTAVFDSP